jgi:hypothetical protein
MGKMKQAELVEEDVVMGVDTSKSQDSTGLQITFPGESAQKEVSLLQVIAAAVKDSTSVDVIERIIDLKNKEEDRAARKAFFQALSKFQSELPEIEKTTIVYNKDGSERYRYAKIGQIARQIKEPMANNGLCFTLSHQIVDKGINIFCTISHVDGHSEESKPVFMPMESPDFMKMTEQQKIGTAHTYGDRYALSGALGIVTIDQDVDGNTDLYENDPGTMKLYRFAIVGLLSLDVFSDEDKKQFKVAIKNLKTVTDYKTYYEMTLQKKEKRSAELKKALDEAVNEPQKKPPLPSFPFTSHSSLTSTREKEELFNIDSEEIISNNINQIGGIIKVIPKVNLNTSDEVSDLMPEMDIF